MTIKELRKKRPKDFEKFEKGVVQVFNEVFQISYRYDLDLAIAAKLLSESDTTTDNWAQLTIDNFF